MVGDIVERNRGFLKLLASTASSRRRAKLIADATSEELLAVVEISVNILKYRFRPRANHMKKLAISADYIRKLARARTPNSARNLLRKGNQSIFKSLILPVLRQSGR